MSTTQLSPSPTPVGGQVTTASPTTTDAAARWKLPTRLVLRFCFVYFTLYCLYTQIIETFVPLPFAQDWPDPSTLPPMRQLVYWTAAHLFHVKTELVNAGSGSGDKTWDWVLLWL